MKELLLEPGHIARQYREAKNKKKQLQILAELNLCTKEEIAEIVRGYGLEVPEEYLKPPPKKETQGVKKTTSGKGKTVLLTENEAKSLVDFIESNLIRFIKNDMGEENGIEWLNGIMSAYSKCKSIL